MRLTSGTEVLLKNRRTGEEARFYIGSLHECRGQYIVYGETKLHWFRLPRGLVQVPSRPGCFVVLRHERGERTMAFSQELGGLDLVITDGLQTLPIVNMGRIQGFWNGDIWDKQAMLEHGAKLIDLWYEWRELGRLPDWFLRLRAASAA